MKITDAIACAEGLAESDVSLVKELVDVWSNKYNSNVLRDQYYHGKVPVKDLGVSVSKAMAQRLTPHIDWAAKCVNWWSDRVQFEGFTSTDEDVENTLREVSRANDFKNVLRKVVSCSLRHSVAFITVTQGNKDLGEPDVVISGYPATAASAIWSDSLKRIKAGLVVVETVKDTPRSQKRVPSVAYVLTDEYVIVLTRDDTTRQWFAQYSLHGMGRVPMEPISYHATLERPFGSSRITNTVMSMVDDAQRELMNMTVTAAFSAAPQKYFLGADASAAKKLSESPYGAFIGSVFTATTNKQGQIPQFGQLGQLSMQPHIDYMRALAASFSGATGVPLSSLGVVHDNPSSAEAILASKEDAIVDINAYISDCKRSLSNIAMMVLAADNNTKFTDWMSYTIDAQFNSPATPSVVSMADAIVKQVSAFPWMSNSDVPLRWLGYEEEQIRQLQSDRKREQARERITAMMAHGRGDTINAQSKQE